MRRALVFDREPMVRERAAQMLALEGFETCTVDSLALFAELREGLAFDLYLAGVASEAEAQALSALGDPPVPLVLLVPGEPHGDLSYLSVAFPGARRVSRGLSDPGALGVPEAPDRGVAARPATGARESVVRRTFGPFGLSERQIEVLGRALLGESTREIASQLFISELTVRNHLHAIYGQVGVSGRRELLGRFVRGLIDADEAATRPIEA